MIVRLTSQRKLSRVFLLAALALMSVRPGLSDEGSLGNLRLIELFTSHGCSSCPSAEEFLGELLASDEDLLALEFHVDYWNDLVHGRDGNFVDPFSDASYSMRQREYNVGSLAGRPGVYTPQAIINGRFAAVGSNRRHITKALASPVEQSLRILVEAGSASETLSVTVTGSTDQINELSGTDIVVAHYIDQADTLVTGGENRHKTLRNHNIVTSLVRLGEVSASDAMSFSVDKPAAGEGCIILVQEDALTPVYAARACP